MDVFWVIYCNSQEWLAWTIQHSFRSQLQADGLLLVDKLSGRGYLLFVGQRF
jgi:hypothetical protein